MRFCVPGIHLKFKSFDGNQVHLKLCNLQVHTEALLEGVEYTL